MKIKKYNRGDVTTTTPKLTKKYYEKMELLQRIAGVTTSGFIRTFKKSSDNPAPSPEPTPSNVTKKSASTKDEFKDIIKEVKAANKAGTPIENLELTISEDIDCGGKPGDYSTKFYLNAKNTTLDLNGKTMSNFDRVSTNLDGATLTVKNGRIKDGCVMTNGDNVTLNLEDVEIESTKDFGVCTYGMNVGVNATVKDCSITALYTAIYCTSKPGQDVLGTLTVENCTLTSTDETPIALKKCNATVTNCTLETKFAPQEYKKVGSNGTNGFGYGVSFETYSDASVPAEGSLKLENTTIKVADTTTGYEIFNYLGGATITSDKEFKTTTELTA